MPDAFVSYAREDRAFVRHVADALAAVGVSVWVDWEGLVPSTEWIREIERAIEGAGAFVFVVSPDSIVSSVCLSELEHARTPQKRLVPLIHREVDQASLPHALAERHWISCLDTEAFDVAIQSLHTCLRRDPEAMRIHTRLLERADEWERHGRSNSFLLRGEDLQDAMRWLAGPFDPNGEHAPTQAQAGYIAASQHSEQEELKNCSVIVGCTRTPRHAPWRGAPAECSASGRDHSAVASCSRPNRCVSRGRQKPIAYSG